MGKATARTPCVVPRLHLLALALALALIGTWATPASVGHAETGLQVLQVGWNGVVVPGTWTPVKVRVTDPRETGTGRIEIVLNNRFQPGPQATPTVYPIAEYAREVPLSTGVSKDLTIWVPAQGPLEGTARLVVGDRILAEQPVNLPTSQSVAQSAALPVVGVLAEAPTVARAVSQIQLSYQGLPVPVPAVSLAAADVPEHAEQLDALSALVVEGSAPAGLTDAQRRAVRDWVAGGGHLLLLGGPDAANAAAVLPADAQPFTFGSTTADEDLAAMARWAGVTDASSLQGPIVSLHAGAGTALVNPGDHPLAWRLALGQGTVTALAADVALDPLASWAHTPALLQKALDPALPGTPEEQKLQAIRRSQESPMRMGSAVEALPPDVFPDALTVGLLLGGFALLAGPIFAIGLGRFSRRGMVWLAVPGAALVLAGGLYAVGVLSGGRDVLENVVGEVYLDPLTGQARQTVVAGFFAPTRGELTVQLPGEASVQATAAANGPGYGRFGMTAPGGQSIPFAVVTGRDTRVEFPTGRWGMRSVYLTRSLDAARIGQVTAHAQLAGQLIRGTVRNDTPFPLEDAAVVVGTSLVKLGNLAPGQTVPFTLDPATVPSPRFKGGSVPLSLKLFGQKDGNGESGYTAAAIPAGVVYTSSGAAPIAQPAPPPYVPISPDEALTLPQDPEIQRRARLLDVSGLSSANFSPFGPSSAELPLTFLAFTRASVGPALPSTDRAVVRQLTLIDEPLSLDVPDGPFTVPAALVPGQIVTMPTSGGFGSGQSGTLFWVELRGGAVTYDFRPPIPPHARVDALELTTEQVGNAVPLNSNNPPVVSPTTKPTSAEAGVFAVYNWQSAAWDNLPAGREQSRVSNATRYLGPEGHVRVRVSAPANHLLRFVPPQLAVDGRGGA